MEKASPAEIGRLKSAAGCCATARRRRAFIRTPSHVCRRRRVVTIRSRRSAEPASRIRRRHIPPTSSPRPRRLEPSRWPGGEQDRSCNGARTGPRGGRWTGHRGRAEHDGRWAPRGRLGSLPARTTPCPHAPHFDRADRIGEFCGNPKTRAFAELLIDCEEERTLWAVLVGMFAGGRPLVSMIGVALYRGSPAEGEVKLVLHGARFGFDVASRPGIDIQLRSRVIAQTRGPMGQALAEGVPCTRSERSDRATNRVHLRDFFSGFP